MVRPGELLRFARLRIPRLLLAAEQAKTLAPFIEIRANGDLKLHLEECRCAIARAFNREPTHFLAGWATLLELRHERITTYRGAPILLDPSRREGLVAVPDLDFLFREGDEPVLPRRARWEP